MLSRLRSLYVYSANGSRRPSSGNLKLDWMTHFSERQVSTVETFCSSIVDHVLVAQKRRCILFQDCEVNIDHYIQPHKGNLYSRHTQYRPWSSSLFKLSRCLYFYRHSLTELNFVCLTLASRHYLLTVGGSINSFAVDRFPGLSPQLRVHHCKCRLHRRCRIRTVYELCVFHWRLKFGCVFTFKIRDVWVVVIRIFVFCPFKIIHWWALLFLRGVGHVDDCS